MWIADGKTINGDEHHFLDIGILKFLVVTSGASLDVMLCVNPFSIFFEVGIGSRDH